MWKANGKAIMYSAIVCLMAMSSLAQSQSWRSVVRVIDGDTIELDNRESVRLIGIDAPEMRGDSDVEARECRAFLQGLIGNRKVRLEFDQKIEDSFGRTLGYVYLEDGTFVNAKMIQQGYARIYPEYPFKYAQQFREQQLQAQSEKNGLWAEGASVFFAETKSAAAIAPIKSTKQGASSSEIAYVTRTGTKYHRAGCRSLRKSAIPMSLQEAASRYGPCSLCRPPVP